MRPPRVGDVIEIPTARGLAYAQLTHKVPSYGPLLRVVEGLWRKRPADPQEVVRAPTRFFPFFPVGATVNRELVALVENVPIPVQFREFPLMRARGQITPDGKVLDWWLRYGRQARRLGALTHEQRKLSIRAVTTDLLLIERIETGWHPDQVY